MLQVCGWGVVLPLVLDPFFRLEEEHIWWHIQDSTCTSPLALEPVYGGRFRCSASPAASGHGEEGEARASCQHWPLATTLCCKMSL